MARKSLLGFVKYIDKKQNLKFYVINNWTEHNQYSLKNLISI